MAYEEFNEPWAGITPADPIGVPTIDISFYPGFDELSTFQARNQALETIWAASTTEHNVDDADRNRLIDFAKSQHDIGIKLRDNGATTRAYECFARSEKIARTYYDLNLLSEILAHQVDLYISMARSSKGIYKDGYAICAMKAAVEAITYADYLGREDINWFGWKVFEAACETGNYKYATHYWFVTTGLENGIVKSFPDTLNYGAQKIKKIFKR